jgi:hypothetical protein
VVSHEKESAEDDGRKNDHAMPQVNGIFFRERKDLVFVSPRADWARQKKIG